MTATDCILALDLGTTAFKAAAVRWSGEITPPVVARYAVRVTAEGVTCDPRLYERLALRALRGTARAAEARGWRPQAIGISSQAQTFVPVGARGEPLSDAIVWTDRRAEREAAQMTEALPDFSRRAGFDHPLPELYACKLAWLRRHQPELHRAARRFPLLNEYIVLRLTGECAGDETNAGMGGLWDIADRRWNAAALAFAGVAPERLARIAPAAGLGPALAIEVARSIGVDPVPVFSCGNDQAAGAAGSGMTGERDALCNFGTAMVVWARKEEQPVPADEDQIAGIDPLTGRYFLLGLEMECGNLVEWLARLLYPRGGPADLIERALAAEPSDVPVFVPRGAGRSDLLGLTTRSTREAIARAAVERFSQRFGEVLAGVIGAEPASVRLYAAGGLSRSRVWLRHLEARHGVRFTPLREEHAGLAGIARIVRERANL